MMSKLIVWIDDDCDSIGSVVRPLQSAGYEFVQIYNASDALSDENVQLIRQADMVLLDLMIPPPDGVIDPGSIPGIEVLRKLRQVHKVQTPVVVLSVIGEAVSRELQPLGISDVIRKPVRPSELKERVLRALALS